VHDLVLSTHPYKYFRSSVLVWLVLVALMTLWWNHNRYGILKAASECKSRVGVRFEKLSFVRRILFSSTAAISKRGCLPQISRWGRRKSLSKEFGLLWRFNIVLTLNRFLLNAVWTLMNDVKAAVHIVCSTEICCIINISKKNTPIDFTRKCSPKGRSIHSG
jgi:hypothetical protein